MGHEKRTDARATPGRTLGVGIVGGSINGGWALQSHLPAVVALEGVKLAAVCTTRQESAQASAERFGAARAYTDVAALTSDPDVDLISVVVRVPEHDSAVRVALAAGKAVYCEAPLGTDTRQAMDLRDAATAAGIKTVVGLQGRVQPVVLQARDLIANGYVGRVLSARSFSAGPWLGGDEIPADREWSVDRENGLTVLSVRTAHTLDVMQFCVAPIVELSATVRVATPAPRISGTDRRVRKTSPDQAVVAGELLGGATFGGQFLLGVHPIATPLLTVFGTAGTLAIQPATADGQMQMSPLSLIGRRGEDAPMPLALPLSLPADPPALKGAAASVARMYAAIRDSWHLTRLSTPTFDDAVALQHLLDVIQQAADDRRSAYAAPNGTALPVR